MKRTFLYSVLILVFTVITTVIIFKKYFNKCEAENFAPGSPAYKDLVENIKKDIDRKNSSAGGPLTDGQVYGDSLNFVAYYRDVQVGGITFPRCINRWDSLDKYLRFSDSIPSQNGISAHYVLDSNKVFVALEISNITTSGITSLGIYQNGTLTPNTYILLKEGYLRSIDQSTFNLMAANYFNSIRIKPAGGSPINISGYAHPKKAFFYRNNFRLLLENNCDTTDTDFNATPKYLSMIWGAHPERSLVFPSHPGIPLMNTIFSLNVGGVDSHFRPDREGIHSSQPYDKRALDLGKLCPPDCTK